MDLIKDIENLIEGSLSGRGYDLVCIQLLGNRPKVLQIMMERKDETGLSLEDCSLASRLVSVLLDNQDLITDPYTLEVSSPGLDRPLLTTRDFRRFCGHMITATVQQAVDGQKRFKGRLIDAGDDEIILDLLPPPPPGRAGRVVIERANIKAARLFADLNMNKTGHKIKDQKSV